MRDLARGIYPPLLADKGLVVALESQARKATVPVTVDAERIGRYPQDIESALYFCTLEALQNVQKYASASAVRVRLREDGGHVHVDVIDDGRGFDLSIVRRGAGLTNMEDRLDALGGSLHLESTLGGGTTLRAAVPVPHAALLAVSGVAARSPATSNVASIAPRLLPSRRTHRVVRVRPADHDGRSDRAETPSLEGGARGEAAGTPRKQSARPQPLPTSRSRDRPPVSIRPLLSPSSCRPTSAHSHFQRHLMYRQLHLRWRPVLHGENVSAL